MLLIILRNCRERQQFKAGGLLDVTDHVVLVQALLDDDDAIIGFFVESGEQGMARPFVGFAAFGVGQRLVRLHRVIRNDDIGTDPGHGYQYCCHVLGQSPT